MLVVNDPSLDIRREVTFYRESQKLSLRHETQCLFFHPIAVLLDASIIQFRQE